VSETALRKRIQREAEKSKIEAKNRAKTIARDVVTEAKVIAAKV
jgi:hypothetical protein